MVENLGPGFLRLLHWYGGSNLIIAPNPRPAENNVFLTQERNNNNKCKKKKNEETSINWNSTLCCKIFKIILIWDLKI